MGISAFKGGNFIMIFPTDLTLTGSEFHRVIAATDKTLVPTFVLTMGTKRRLIKITRSKLSRDCLSCRSEQCIS